MIDRPEINLEISTGFFRISTDTVVYNITVIPGPESPAAKVVQQIVSAERPAPQMEPAAAPAPVAPPVSHLPGADEEGGYRGDDFYKQISSDIYKDIGNLAKSLSSTIMELPAEDRKIKRAELDEAGEKIEDAKNQLRDIVSMTEKATMEIMDHVEKVQSQTADVKELLAQLKHHEAFVGGAEEGGDAGGASAGASAKVAALKEQLATVQGLLEGLGSAEAAPPPVAAAPKKLRYLFSLDTVFQTIYELCTNETVKSHISMAREQAATIFNYDLFVDTISATVSELVAEDNFYNVPLSDVLGALRTACTEKKIQNLLKKMDTSQGEIFLDSILPLEAPSTEEVAGEAAEPAPAPAAVGVDPARLAEFREALAAMATLVEAVAEEVGNGGDATVPPGMSRMSLEDQAEIFAKIENAFTVATSICDDVTRITEALSFQDLSGQQIMKIIKLLSDFQVQLLALVVSFGSQLKSKERNA
ncbi:MAG TPA: protein phosphatase CheZ, partial [Desulfurivibrionaceae bacterium]|nr:protein phosphatase CheZ [Desulfurivibrionaceae bacterium]